MTGHRLEFKDGSIIHIKDYFVKAKSYQFDNTCYHCAFYHYRICHLNEDPITKRLSCVHSIKKWMDSTAFIKI